MTGSKKPVGLSSRVSILMGIFVIVLVVGFSVPAAAAVRTSATVKQWPVSFFPNDFVVAPDGTLFFSAPGVLVGRLNPATNELTTWPIATFHLAIGPAFSVELDGQTFTDDFTLALIRTNGQVRLLLPSSGVVVRWDLPAGSLDITASSTHIWATQLTEDDSTLIASLDPVTDVVTTYDLPQSIAGPGGFIHGLSFGGDRLWFGVTAAEIGETVPITQKTGALDPATSTAKVWTLFSSHPDVVVGIGRAATFAAGSSWTSYHSSDPILTGAYRLKPDAGKVEFYPAPFGTPASSGPFPVFEGVDRATMAAGAVWAAGTSEKESVQTAQVARWQPLGFRSVSFVSPEEPTVTVSTDSLTRSVSVVTPEVTTITPVTTTITGAFTSPNVTVWNFADRRLQTRIVVSLAGVVYFGLLTPSTDDVVLAQLST